MIDFPTSPTVGTIVTSPNGNQWRWDGTVWQSMRSVGVQTADTRGYTFFQESAPTATRVGDTWMQNSTAYTYTWNGAVWFRSDQTGYTFYGDATPTGNRAGDTWYHPSTGHSYVWSGAAWLQTSFPKLDYRARWTSAAQNYPGTNGPLYFHNTTWNSGGVQILGNGYQIQFLRAGLWSLNYYVQWNTSTTGTNNVWVEKSDGTRFGTTTIENNTTQAIACSATTVLAVAANDLYSIRVYSAPAAANISNGTTDVVLITPW